MKAREWVARGIDHLGLTVPDVGQASDFLTRAFGAEVLYDLVVPGAEGVGHVEPAGAQPALYDRGTALGMPPEARIQRVRLMRIGNGPSLELFEFAGVNQRPAAVNTDIGMQHFAVYVGDITEAARRVDEAGGHLFEGPFLAPGWESGKGSRFHYARAPWGTLIELITYPNGQLHDGHGRVDRWSPKGAVSVP